MPQSNADPEQLAGRNVQNDDLIAPGGGPHHAYMTVQQQIKPINRCAFCKNRTPRVKAAGLSKI